MDTILDKFGKVMQVACAPPSSTLSEIPTDDDLTSLLSAIDDAPAYSLTSTPTVSESSITTLPYDTASFPLCHISPPYSLDHPRRFSQRSYFSAPPSVTRARLFSSPPRTHFSPPPRTHFSPPPYIPLTTCTKPEDFINISYQ